MCGADAEGEGAEVQFDAETRSAIMRLGGLFGGILDGPNGARLLWCSRGVCLVEDHIGLAWRADAYGQVTDVSIGREEVLVTTAGGARTALSLEDGSEIE